MSSWRDSRNAGRVATASSKLEPYWSKRKHGETVKFEVNLDHSVAKECISSIENPNDRKKLLHFLTMIGATLPVDSIFVELGDREQGLRQGTVETDALVKEFERCCRALRDQNFENEEIGEILKITEPFKSNEEAIEHLIREHL